MSKTPAEKKTFDTLVVGCGSRGLQTLSSLIGKGEENIGSLEASSRIGGTHFLISRLTAAATGGNNVFEVVRTLPEIKIWWERNWVAANEIDWSSKEWAYVLPQWKTFFESLVELKVKNEVLDEVKSFVQLEKPVSEISHDGILWTLRSGEKTYQARNVYWTLGLKSFQSCYGKKEAEEFMDKNPQFDEMAREAEGAMVATYKLPVATPDTQFLGIPVRHDHKLYLTFVSIHGDEIETFTFLHQDLLKFPKELSSFEKSIRRTLKHTLANYVTELSAPMMGVFDEAKGYTMASPWKLKDSSEKGIFFVGERQPTVSETSESLASRTL